MKLSREAKTGIFAILILALAIWGFNYLKGKNILNPTNEYYVKYANIEGIIESGNVLYRGFKVGNINGIVFDSDSPEFFVVKFNVNKNINIPVGSKIFGTQTNLIASTKDLVIEFSDAKEFYNSGDTVVAGYKSSPLEMLEPYKKQLDNILSNIDTTLFAIKETLNAETRENLQQSVSALKLTIGSIESMMAPGGTLNKSLKNVESITSNIKDKNQEISKSIDNLANATSALDSAGLQRTLMSLDSTLLATNAIMNKINNNEGTAGLLVNDSSLYINLSSATASLDSLLTDLKENPKRYVHLSVFGGKDK
ncbi:MAG: MCE family protein [Bacteroidales bacterium]|nr:MCE family protein [Bacteroidales bacterium]MBN2818569.1 MCE family protein [Bacteroidales bacterium]